MQYEDHVRILELAARGALPDQIDEQSELPIAVVRELVEAGCLQALDSSSMDGDAYLEPRITLKGRQFLRQLQRDTAAPERDLIATLERMRDIMVAVSTGGPRIDDVNPSYRELYNSADSELRTRGIPNPIPFPDLWDWYGRWRSGDLPSYQSRREFLADLYAPVFEQVRTHATGRPPVVHEVTGWPKVDRTVGELRRRLAEAETEEQFQAVGLLCREAMISLAQAVHDPAKHLPLDGKEPSETDAKRMLESYLAAELEGSSSEVARRHARASYDLAVELQHRRTAAFRQAALCVEATSSLINVIAIVSGKRDPAGS
jgi:hypothetical protein